MRLNRSQIAIIAILLALSATAYLVSDADEPMRGQTTELQAGDGPKGVHDAKGAGYYCVSAGFCFCHNQTECDAMLSSGECVPNTVRYSKSGMQSEASCQWQQKH